MKKYIWMVVSMQKDSPLDPIYIHCESRKEARAIKNEEKAADWKALILKYELVGEVR